MGGRSITSSNTSGRLGVWVFLVVSVQSELVTSSTTAPGAGSTAIPDTLKYMSLEIRNKQRKGRKRQTATAASCKRGQTAEFGFPKHGLGKKC